MAKSICCTVVAVIALVSAVAFTGCGDTSGGSAGRAQDAVLTDVSADYNQSGTVYPGTPLDNLKTGLTVTAHYDDGTANVLGASEYTLSGTLVVPSSVITVSYGGETAFFTVAVAVGPDNPDNPDNPGVPGDVIANLYANASPDTPVDLSFTSGGNIIDKAFNYVNANPGAYTFKLESDIDVADVNALHPPSLTRPGISLAIIGLGAERKIRLVSGGAFNLGEVGVSGVTGIELILGNNCTFEGGYITVYAGALEMRGNSKITGSSTNGGVIVRDGNTFIMRDSASLYGNTSAAAAGGVSVLYGGTFIMEGNASVYGNTATNTNSGVGGVYVGGGGGGIYSTFTMRGNASVHGNDGYGGLGIAMGGGGVSVQSGGKVIMEDSASIHGNIGRGVHISDGSLTMSGDASVHGNAIFGNGGGVYMSGSGSLAMSGSASIHNNTAGGEVLGSALSGNGGGVYMTGSGSFTMSDNVLIYGNAAVGATGSGGGVYIGSNSRFTMSGGKIYGLDATPVSLKNTAGQSGAALFLYSAAGAVEYGDGTAIAAKGIGVDVTVTGSGKTNNTPTQNILDAVLENRVYTAKDSVAAYIFLFRKLPSNYVGKDIGKTLYESKTGNVFSKWNFNPWTLLGVMIGGDIFYNDEQLLPQGASYKECDVDYHDSSRGTKRLVYTSGGAVYYTADHYESFANIYGSSD